jgi:catechol 2,3-dioxygenase-like lactoylglutathione lyase family enzyme
MTQIASPLLLNEGAIMTIGMTKVLHVKIPVSDLQRSVTWYCELLDLEVFREFAEQGALRGAALLSREGGFAVALREREFCAGQPDLAGFDPFAVHMASRDALGDLAAKCDRRGIEHSPVQDRGPDEAVVDVPDPDGTVLRFYWMRDGGQPERFTGLDFDATGRPASYDTPRLSVPSHQ